MCPHYYSYSFCCCRSAYYDEDGDDEDHSSTPTAMRRHLRGLLAGVTTSGSELSRGLEKATSLGHLPKSTGSMIPMQPERPRWKTETLQFAPNPCKLLLTVGEHRCIFAWIAICVCPRGYKDFRVLTHCVLSRAAPKRITQPEGLCKPTPGSNDGPM